MDKSIILLNEACETCERIFSSPVPLVYTRHTARFLSMCVQQPEPQPYLSMWVQQP